MTELLLARRRAAIFLGLFLLAVVILTMQMRTPDRRQVGPIGSVMLAVLMPVQSAMVRIADRVAAVWAQFSEIGRLRVENARLRGQVGALRQQVAAFREAAATSERMQRLLKFREQLSSPALAARAIGRDPSRWFATLVIDRGSRDGIVRNAPVVTPDGVVGRVIEVTPTTARVLLITDSRSALGVLIQDSRDPAVVEGRGGRLLHLKYLSRTTKVSAGDIVVTSGLGGVFPRGLVVGRIVQMMREEGALLQDAEVEPAAALDRLEEVLVLLPRY